MPGGTCEMESVSGCPCLGAMQQDPECPYHGRDAVSTPGMISVNGNLYCSLCNTERMEFAPPMVCEHVVACIRENEDGPWPNPIDDISVPVFPDANIWAQVVLMALPGEDDIAKIRLVYEDDLTIDRSVTLGLWTRGEGRLSIRAAILEHVRSKVDPREDFSSSTIWTQCPSKTHGFPQIQAIQHNAEVWFKQACMWYIAMEEACLPCVEATLSSTPDDDPQDDTKDGPVNPTPSTLPAGIPVGLNAAGQLVEAKQGEEVRGISLGDGQVMTNGQTFEAKDIQIFHTVTDDKASLSSEEIRQALAQRGIHFA